MIASSHALSTSAAVAEHDLHLTGRIFRDQRLGRQALGLGKSIEIAEERREVVEVLQVIGLVMLRAWRRW